MLILLVAGPCNKYSCDGIWYDGNRIMHVCVQVRCTRLLKYASYQNKMMTPHQPACFPQKKAKRMDILLVFWLSIYGLFGFRTHMLFRHDLHLPGAQKACIGCQDAQKGYALGRPCDHPHMGNNSSIPQIN